MDSIIFQRITELCEERGTTINKVERELGLAVSTIIKWKDIKRSPSVFSVKKVADYFGVSMEYLLGETDNRISLSEVLADDGVVSLQRAMNNLTPSDKTFFMKMLKGAFGYAFEEDNNN